MEAILALEDGRVWRGRGFGARRAVTGEVVFNTAMTGYQEILTDPSYCGQIVTMTYPLIGNYGVNDEDIEARRTFAEGFVVRELSRTGRIAMVRGNSTVTPDRRSPTGRKHDAIPSDFA